MFGGSDGVSLRGIHDQNTLLGRGRNIDVVDTDASTTDDFQAACGSDHLGGDLRAGTNHEAVVVTNDGNQFIL